MKSEERRKRREKGGREGKKKKKGREINCSVGSKSKLGPSPRSNKEKQKDAREKRPFNASWQIGLESTSAEMSM